MREQGDLGTAVRDSRERMQSTVRWPILGQYQGKKSWLSRRAVPCKWSLDAFHVWYTDSLSVMHMNIRLTGMRLLK
jgi:hypothetical protein